MRVRRNLLTGLVLAATLALGACGFTPMYGAGGAATGLSDIRVETGEERIDFLLQEALLDAMDARNASGPYTLRTETDLSSRGLGIGADAIVSRFQIEVEVDYAVVDSSGESVITGQVTGQASYDLSSSPYASLASEQDAEERAARMAADRLTAHLVRAFSQLDAS